MKAIIVRPTQEHLSLLGQANLTTDMSPACQIYASSKHMYQVKLNQDPFIFIGECMLRRIEDLPGITF